MLPLAFLFMLAVIFILPFFSAEGYSMVTHTTSQLAAQHAPNAWVMNLTFILLGTTSILDGWKRLKNYWFQKITISIFGFALVLTAFFQHAPIDPNLAFDMQEDHLHSLFASITGFAFTFFAVSCAFIEPTKLRKTLAFFIGVLATLLSLLIFNMPAYAGIWQRLIFISSFAWLILFFQHRSTFNISSLSSNISK